MVSGPEGQADALAVLRRLSLHTKALVIASEFTQKQTSPGELRLVLEALASDADERRKITQAVEEELRSARYPAGEIAHLMAELASVGQPQGRSSPGVEAGVVVTRKLSPPSLKPFDKLELEQPEDLPAPGERKGMKIVLGGETASFSPTGFKKLAMKPAFPPGTRQMVLVADDDARARIMYKAKIEEAGFSVAEAKDGIEAWNLIKSGTIQCAVMDMKMPGYHGLEILSRMIDSNLLLPVVVVSAFDQLANEFVVATYPKLRFLTKPAPPEAVAQAVNELLRPGKRIPTPHAGGNPAVQDRTPGINP